MIAMGALLATAAFAAMGLAGSAPAAPAQTAMDAVGPVNPDKREIAVSTRVPAGVKAVRLRVTLPRGTTVALGPVVPVTAPGTVTLTWNGRRGIGARGGAVPDGRYILGVVAPGDRRLDATPSEALVDRTGPRVKVSEAEPTIPARRPTAVRLTVRDREWDRGGPVQVRLIVSTREGRTLAAGPWTDAADTVALPAKVTGSSRVGQVRVTVRSRDAAGNTGAAAKTMVALPGPAGPARKVTRVTTRKRFVALTIDDGYDAAAMSSMVDTAIRKKAPLTFCINGRVLSVYGPALRAKIRRAAADGWLVVCSHGYSHETGTGTSEASARSDLTRNVVWDRLAGQSSIPFYRPPYGAVGPGILAAASGLGYRNVLLWDVDTLDWDHRDAGRTESSALSARAGSIVLMHAIPSSATALPRIIDGLRARGLEPVGIGDLINAGTPTG